MKPANPGRAGLNAGSHAIFLAIGLLCGLLPLTASHAAQERTMLKIQIEVEGLFAIAALDGSAAARDFASLLPLTVTLEDYASTEKIADLPHRLSTLGAPAGSDARQGDLSYYAPWGNLVIFLKDFKYSEGLVTIGRIESGMDVLRRKGAIKASIRIVGTP